MTLSQRMDTRKSFMTMAVLATFTMGPLTVHAQASVELINLIGDPITASCVSDNANRGIATINSDQIDAWTFNGDLLSMGWTCHFEWTDSSACNPACAVHTQDVKVWQGVMVASRRLDVTGLISLTPCVNCVWQIKFDGFYRADKKDLIYALIAGWN